jgi:hypothetical protein
MNPETIVGLAVPLIGALVPLYHLYLRYRRRGGDDAAPRREAKMEMGMVALDRGAGERLSERLERADGHYESVIDGITRLSNEQRQYIRLTERGNELLVDIRDRTADCLEELKSMRRAGRGHRT